MSGDAGRSADDGWIIHKPFTRLLDDPPARARAKPTLFHQTSLSHLTSSSAAAIIHLRQEKTFPQLSSVRVFLPVPSERFLLHVSIWFFASLDIYTIHCIASDTCDVSLSTKTAGEQVKDGQESLCSAIFVTQFNGSSGGTPEILGKINQYIYQEMREREE